MGLRLMPGPAFPVQAAAVSRLLASSRSLAHALLLHGPRGIGKAAVAAAIAKALLCEAPDRERPIRLACERCSSCRWFDAGNHPDVRTVGLLTNSQGKQAWDLSIDQIRD